jgi:hypothetical protein
MADCLSLSLGDRQALAALAADPATPHRMRQRVLMIELAARGHGVPAIARAVGVSARTVRVWLDRVARLGVKGLADLAPGDTAALPVAAPPAEGDAARALPPAHRHVRPAQRLCRPERRATAAVHRRQPGRSLRTPFA